MAQITLWFAIALGAFGLLIGSFLNVVAIRVLNQQSIAYPPSHCVHCKHRLRAWDLIPLLSYAVLRGRCRYCRAPISAAYPLGEGAAAILFFWTGLRFGPLDLEWIAGILLCSVLVVVTHTDLKAMLIPDKIVFPSVALAILLRLLIHPLPLWNYVAAAAIGFGLLYLLAVVSKGGMGGGDIKLYLFIGLICGIAPTLLSLFAASLFGTVYGLARKLVGRGERGREIPFGPFIAAGAIGSFFYGNAWIEAYLNLWIL